MLHPRCDVEALSLNIGSKEGNTFAETAQRCQPRRQLCSLSIRTILLNAALMQFSGSPLRLLPRPACILHNSFDSKRTQELKDGSFGTAFRKVGVNQKRILVLPA